MATITVADRNLKLVYSILLPFMQHHKCNFKIFVMYELQWIKRKKMLVELIDGPAE